MTQKAQDGLHQRPLNIQDDLYQGAGAVEFVPVRKYFWFDGRMVGSKGSGNSQEWMQPDRLGSHARVYPYGEEMAATTTFYRFATYQRGGGGLDYAMNRHYSPVYGQFTSADPYRASAGPSDPGSWNRYAYVQGDPVNFNDPMGLLACGVDTPNSINVCDTVSGSVGGGGGSDDMQDGAESYPSGDQSQGESGTGYVYSPRHIAEDIQRDFLLKRLSDCEALARFADRVAATPSIDIRGFVSAFGVFVSSGPPAVRAAAGVGLRVASSSNPLNFDPREPRTRSGYNSAFRDSDPLSQEQNHHFAAYFQFAFVAGPLLSVTAGLLSDIGNPGDQTLAANASGLAIRLRDGKLVLKDVGTAIRDRLCDQSWRP